ncbi:MAG TPA: HD domain-containing protein [Malonomonas sp.]
MTDKLKPADLIRKYYAPYPEAWQILLDHSRRVTQRALRIARRLQQTQPVDLKFIAEAAMLHDIGIFMTDAPSLGCTGEGPYLCHGIKGRQLLEEEGLPRHALVCERHIGVGLTAEEIRTQDLPLPARDMLPLSLEEQIICYADLFYSKDKDKLHKEKSPAKVRKVLAKYGADKGQVFARWQSLFEAESV